MSIQLSPLATNTILYCHRWQQTVTFYRDSLGLPITFENDWFVEFRIGPAAHLSIADERRATIKSSQGGGITLTFQVTDADALWARFQQANLNPGPLKDHAWSARVFYLYDPEGHRLEIWSAKKD